MFKLNNWLKVFINSYLMLLQVSVALSRSSTRIVGGTPTTIDKAPYLVQIRDDGSILCGGTLISDTCVLTAAHCFDNHPKRLSVVAGATKLTDKGIQSKIKKIMIPTAYNNKTYHADIAVIKLRTPLKGDLVQPTTMCEDDWNTGEVGRLYGWGKREEDADSIPIQLHTVDVNIIERSLCEKTYRSRHDLTDSMICAGNPGKDSCSGDSGGPFMKNDQICGVVSWGIGCARDDSPGVYTDLKKFAGFIDNARQK